MLWAVFALLTGVAIFAVLWPLSRAPATTDSKELDVAFYKAQTAEIERDATRGVIGAQEAETARNEAARRLMAASQRATADVGSGSRFATRSVALGVLIFVPALALGLYAYVGTPNMPDDPLEARLDAPASTMDMPTAIAKIERHLAKNPDDGRGWAVIAPIYVRLGRYDDAVRAFTNEIRTLGPSGERYAGLGEAQVYLANGMIDADAKKSFEQAAVLDPKSPRAAYYLGLAAQQDGDKANAVAIWTRLVAESPPDAPWLPTVRARLAEVGGAASAQADNAPAAPDAGRAKMAEAVAAMPKDQQQAMIHRMVDGLADRLKTNGGDIEGWLRLMRAYQVLNEQDKAKLALSDARRNFAADPSATKRIDDLAHELGLEG
jgi:cytochrome c-type biogenesis protein CcmH